MPHTGGILSSAKNLCLLLSTFLLFFVGGEVLLRTLGVSPRPTTPPIYERNPHPAISYTLKPHLRMRAFRSTITTNSLGVRSPELDPRKPTLLVLGDSITFGYGVEDSETLPAQLQLLLPQVNVLNAGIPGYHIRQEGALLRSVLLPLQPAALILIFYSNDVDLQTSWLDERGILRPEGWTPLQTPCAPIEEGILGWIPGRCFLDLHSAFYRAVKNIVNTRIGFQERKRIREGGAHIVREDSLTEEKLSQYSAELSELTSLLPEDFPRLFVLFPDAERHEYSRPILRTIAENHGFEVLDLFDHLGNTYETLRWDYVHPSAQTLQKAAGIIAEAWKDLDPPHKDSP